MAQENDQHNTECKSELHSQHLCYFISQGSHLTNEEKYKDMVSDPEFKCEYCERVANSDKNLCKPISLFV
ncbi:MAG: hypothetical protein ACYSSP_10870 [Planctomycetota bacterium]|jgi:hypothetical protein